MNLYDMHADTPYEMFKLGTNFDDGRLHISRSKLHGFEKYHQIFAIWCDYDKENEEVFSDFFTIRDKFINDINKSPVNNLTYTFSVEDARLLNGDINRLSLLYDAGVRILTLVWKGCSVIGGAYDTNFGLTDFGKETLYRCFDLGIIPDVSHSSHETFACVYEASAERKMPFIATHSNSFSVCQHKRNLTDDEFLKIKGAGGIVGISLAPAHLSLKEAHVTDVVKHIEHYLSLSGEDVVCLGCDFDGIDSTPCEIKDISQLYNLKNELLRLGYKDELIEKIFFNNANSFVSKHILHN